MKKLTFLCLYTALILLVKYFGLFQPIELNLYDHYWQRSPIEAPDSNIVIVGIDEADLNKVNWPITNDNLANLILNIEEQKPAVIGLDIFRDLGISGKLKQIFQESDQLVGVGLHQGVAFPPILKARERVGTVAVVDEPVFGELRRIYLYALADGSKDSRIPYISLKLVWEYLKAQGNLEITGDEATGYLKVNGQVIPRTEDKSGGYTLDGFAGYPYLVRWRKGNYQEEQWEDRFPIFTYREAMTAPSDTFTDKIVIIGYRAQSIKDQFITPLGWRYGVDVVAQTTSDLLSHIQENRPIFKFIPEGLEYGLLILMIALAYGHYHFSRLSHVWREIALQGAIAFLIFATIYSLGYLSFRQALWIPVGQLLLTYAVSVIIFLALRYQFKIHRINEELEGKLQQKEEELTEIYEKRSIEEKQILLGQFAAEMTHDINSELAVLNMESAYFQQRLKSPLEFAQWLILIQEAEDLEWIEETLQINHWQELIDSLGEQTQAISRLRESLETLQAVYRGYSPATNPIDINEELQTIIAKWESQLAQWGISLVFSPTPLSSIKYSPIIFRQIMNHLLRNAKDAILEKQEEKGEINIETGYQAQKIYISIRDNGSGMTPEIQAQASDFLFSTKTQGMGYGLYFVFSQLQDNIQLNSQPQQGTTVTIFFS